MRILELREGSGIKYWQVHVDGTVCRIEFGLRGAPPRSESKFYGSTAQAESAVEALIARQLRLGYLEVATPSDAGSAPDEVDALLDQLAELTGREVARVATRLSRLGASDRVTALLTDDGVPPAARVGALKVLAETRATASGAAIAPLLEHGDAELRRAAAWALGELRALECAAALRAAASDRAPAVRREARQALDRLRLPLLEEAQARRDQELRHCCSGRVAPEEQARRIRELCAGGAQVNAVDDHGVSPLLLAAESGPLDAVEALLALGARLDAVDDDGRTALHHACAGFDPTRSSASLGLAAAELEVLRDEWLGERRAMVDRLLQLGLAPDARAQGGVTPLHLAAAGLDARGCERLLAAGAALEAPSHNGTPLAWAALRDNRSAAELLLERGAVVTSELVESAREHEHYALAARLERALGGAREASQDGDSLQALRRLARALGGKGASSAVESGDRDHYLEIGNDVDDLSSEYWCGHYREKLEEAIAALDDAARRSLPADDELLGQLEDEYHAGWAEELPPARSSEPVLSQPRRFELVEGTSSKFWEITRQGGVLLTRFGRLGSKGQTRRKELASEEQARRELEKLVAEKLRKGYQER